MMDAQDLKRLQQGMTERQKDRFVDQYRKAKKSRTTAFDLARFLGVFGAGRFYVGDTAIGFLKLFTLGGFFVFAFIDVFLIQKRADEYNRKKAEEIARRIRG